MTNSSYGLFYRKINKEYEYLVCKIYHGIKIDDIELISNCKENNKKVLRNPGEIKSEIAKKMAIVQSRIPEIVNVRPHIGEFKKMYYVADNNNNFYNFLGGQKESGETDKMDISYFCNRCNF